eukprot:16384590-Heterocapsa_arctica.AAC.1
MSVGTSRKNPNSVAVFKKYLPDSVMSAFSRSWASSREGTCRAVARSAPFFCLREVAADVVLGASVT